MRQARVTDRALKGARNRHHCKRRLKPCRARTAWRSQHTLYLYLASAIRIHRRANLLTTAASVFVGAAVRITTDIFATAFVFGATTVLGATVVFTLSGVIATASIF